MKKHVFFVALLLVFGVLFSACAQAENAPRNLEAVTDLADVLSPETEQDITTLNTRMKREWKGRFLVITRHFLGGKDVRQYAAELFESWGLSQEDALLVMVIGEETYTLHLGKTAAGYISTDEITAMLATHFRGAYLNREYDAALADVALTYTSHMNRSLGKNVKTSDLLGSRNQQAAAYKTDPISWLSGMFSEITEDKPMPKVHLKGINIRSAIIWGLVIYFVFFRKKHRMRRRQRRAEKAKQLASNLVRFLNRR